MLHLFLMLKVFSAWQRKCFLDLKQRDKNNSVISVSGILAVYHSFRIAQEIQIVKVQIDWFKIFHLAECW